MLIGIDCRLLSESGVGRYTRNLVSCLQELDKENDYILFVLSKDKEKFKIQNSKFKIQVADIRWHSFGEQWKFLSVLNSHRLDLVHFPYFSLPVSYSGKFVVTIHDLILHHFPTGQASTLNPFFYRIKLLGYKYIVYKAAQKAKRIITVTNATKHEIVQHLKVQPDKIVVTPEGIDEQITRNKLQETNKIKNYFLYVGNAYPHKNLSRLLEGFSLMQKEYGTKLVFVGRDDYFYQRLKEEVEKMELSDSVVFCGEATDAKLSDLYQQALALVMPSVMEGFGLPGIEAMAKGCLVVSSNIPAHKEVYADAAIFFNPEDVSEIAKTLEKAVEMKKSEKDKVIEKGKQRVKQFSWEKMAEETLSIYKEELLK